MGTIRFILRKDKQDKNGLQPIELIYQVSGQRKSYRTRQKLLPVAWDSESQRARSIQKTEVKQLREAVDKRFIPTSIEIDETNRELDGLSNEIRDIERRFELDGIAYSSLSVIKVLKEKKGPNTKKEERSDSIYRFIDTYIEEHRSIRQPGSLTVYKSLKTHLLAFQEATKLVATFAGIDASFFRKFQSFLITDRNLNNTTVAKQLSTLKTFLNYARADGITVSDNYKQFKITKPTLEVIALSKGEYDQMLHADFSSHPRLDRVRDIFCFMCATGMRFSDITQLQWEHIKENKITFTVKKTKQPHSIDLNHNSSFILSKYKDKLLPLPRITNQVFNRYIKEVAKHIGINEPIEIVRMFGNRRQVNVYPKYELVSAHVARKTFITLSLQMGMQVHVAMAFSGHKSWENFQRYVHAADKHKKQQMEQVWGTPVQIQKNVIQLKAVS